MKLAEDELLNNNDLNKYFKYSHGIVSKYGFAYYVLRGTNYGICFCYDSSQWVSIYRGVLYEEELSNILEDVSDEVRNGILFNIEIFR